MVETFEIESGSFRLWGSHADLSSASASLPEGSYTTLRTYGRDRILRLEQHLRRLEDSLPTPARLEEAAVRGALATALERTAHHESRLRLTFAPPRLFVSVAPFEPLPEATYRDGVRCVTVGLRRDNPQAKQTGFIAKAASTYAALPEGINEGLMLGEEGAVLEGLSSNFFAALRGVLRTEQARALGGVTRAIVLEVAESVLAVERQAVRADQLASVDECFLTSVSREILPVVEVDGRRIGDGKPGGTTRELMRRFRGLVEREARPPTS
jgi:branched-chain amino acid aminotransferase